MGNTRNLGDLLNTDSTIATADVADGGITTAKLADDAVTQAKIGADAVGTTELANDVAISTSGAITTTGAFTSVGIDDNADATAITISSDEDVSLGAGDLTVSRNEANGTVRLNLSNTGSNGSSEYSELKLNSTAGGTQTSIIQHRNNYGLNIGTTTDHPIYFLQNNATAMAIDASGFVTKPLQPITSLYGDTVRVQTSSANTDVDVSFLERFDSTNSYDTANKYYDVPVDGKYLINFFASVKSNTSYILIKIKVGSTTVALSYGEEPNINADWVARSCQTILDLNDGDAVRFQFATGSSTSGGGQILENAYRGAFICLLA